MNTNNTNNTNNIKKLLGIDAPQIENVESRVVIGGGHTRTSEDERRVTTSAVTRTRVTSFSVRTENEVLHFEYTEGADNMSTPPAQWLRWQIEDEIRRGKPPGTVELYLVFTGGEKSRCIHMDARWKKAIRWEVESRGGSLPSGWSKWVEPTLWAELKKQTPEEWGQFVALPPFPGGGVIHVRYVK